MRKIVLFISLWCLSVLAAAADDHIYISHDIDYGNGQQLDVYSTTPPGKKVSKPVILLVHGGGFWEGDKQSKFYIALAESFARKGYVAISINYRLKGKDQVYTQAVLDTCMADVMKAYEWMKANAVVYGMDIETVAIVGDSAGGGIVVNTCYDHPALFIACVDLWGGLPGGEGWEAPIYSRALPATIPPTLIMHGTSDRIIPFRTSRNLYDHLRLAGVPARLTPLPAADHYPVQLKEKIIDTMAVFLNTIFHSRPARMTQPLSLVDPFIGTGNGGNTNPGAVRPWSLASVAPFNTYDPGGGNAGPSPYVYGRKTIYGFTHLNMSGLGCGDLGIICLMADTGVIRSNMKAGSPYSREKASPGYYAVSLTRPGIDAEFTTTCRTSLSSFAFPEGNGQILMNLGMGLTERKGGTLRLVSDTEVEGSKNIGNICGLQSMQTVYFVMRVSRTPASAGVWTQGKYFDDFRQATSGNDIGAYFKFHTEAGEKILVKTGISYVSMANARENLEAEQPGFDFDRTLRETQEEWNTQLSRIKVEGGKQDDKVQFYTALYHALIHPGRADDVNGQYRCFESNETGTADSSGRYSVFSLWDTYRTLHPLLSLIYPEKQSAMVRSLIGMSEEGGWLPRWEYAGIETGAMTGDPSLPVIADTYMRGIRDFDVKKAYAAMKRNAVSPETESYMRPGMGQWLALGYIPDDGPNILRPFDTSAAQKEAYPFMKTKRIVWGSVSTVMEYCIADWNLAQLAGALGYKDDQSYFMKRALTYRNCFDPSLRLMRPRLQNGEWVSPFDPASRRTTAFTEGSSWNYSFMAPFDITALIQMMGGPAVFRKKLDSCFDQGYFDITNEPDLAYPYLYNYLPGEEWRTGLQVGRILSQDFHHSPGGLPGNDDCGEISAWLLCSMMGLYPDCPGKPDYQLTNPVFKKVTIFLDQKYYPGRTIVITSNVKGSRIRSIYWNGRRHAGYSILHQDIVKGGWLEIKTK